MLFYCLVFFIFFNTHSENPIRIDFDQDLSEKKLSDLFSNVSINSFDEIKIDSDIPLFESEKKQILAIDDKQLSFIERIYKVLNFLKKKNKFLQANLCIVSLANKNILKIELITFWTIGKIATKSTLFEKNRYLKNYLYQSGDRFYEGKSQESLKKIQEALQINQL